MTRKSCTSIEGENKGMNYLQTDWKISEPEQHYFWLTGSMHNSICLNRTFIENPKIGIFYLF